MRHYPGTAWTAARLATLAATAALLAGCMIISEEELVADSEGASLLPATAYLTGYEEDGPNAWKLGDDEVQVLTLNGGTYSGEDGSLNVRFVPLEGVPDTYLTALVSVEGSIYGVSTLRNDILVVEVVLSDPDPIAAVEAAGRPELAGIVEEDGGLKVTTREQLDGLVQLYLDGTLTLAGLVMYVSTDPDATAPARIVKDNGDYRGE